ncbi:MAG: hypothetical protein C5B50_04180 [Verrucomicrobia bacterium]|nr:MAG: hypothetical protein C5B50_04180 [Verrucomicrobiota bacterium]
MTSSPIHSRNGTALAAAVLLVLVTAGTYLNSLPNKFINYDDPIYVFSNPHVTGGFTWDNIRWAFTSLDHFWHPVTWLSIMLDWQLFGAQPWGHHLVSVLLHTASALMLFEFLRRTTGAVWRSFFAAAFFGVHPLHVESVVWAAERKDVLSGFFFMLTLIAYARFARGFRVQGSGSEGPGAMDEGRELSQTGRGGWTGPTRGVIWYLSSLLFFALGLMSKSMVVTVPVILLLLDFWPLKRVQSPSTYAKASADKKSKVQSAEPTAPEREFRVQSSKFKVQGSSSSPDPRPSTLGPRRSSWSVVGGLFLEKIPFFVLSALMSGLTIVAQNQTGALQTAARLPMVYRVENAVLSYAEYLWQTVWPTRLAVFYSYPKFFPVWLVLGLTVAGCAFTAAVLWWARRRPWLAVGWGWYLITLLPVIGIVQVGSQAHADRYTYLPLIGIFIAVVWEVAELGFQGSGFRVQNLRGVRAEESGSDTPTLRRSHALTLLGVAALCCYIWLTWCQVGYWRDSEKLFGHALQVQPNNEVAHVNMGTALETKAQSLAQASARARDPQERKALSDQAAQLENQAAQHFQDAVQAQPSFAVAHCDLAAAYLRRHRTEPAIYHAQKALDLNYTGAHRILGAAYGEAGNLEKAIYHLRLAVQLAHTTEQLAEAHHNLGYALWQKGLTNEAKAEFQEEKRLQTGPRDH